MTGGGLGWGAIVRLGLVQSAIGAVVMLTTALLNRVMVVELGLAAAVPAGLVAWHYAVQLSRPLWGHGSDRGGGRTQWIVGGMGVLALGALLAVNSVAGATGWSRTGLSILAFTLIGAGVGAAGTSLLALLASGVAPARRAPAAAITWIMMVAGIAITGAEAPAFRLVFGIEAGLFLVAALLALQGGRVPRRAGARA